MKHVFLIALYHSSKKSSNERTPTH